MIKRLCTIIAAAALCAFPAFCEETVIVETVVVEEIVTDSVCADVPKAENGGLSNMAASWVSKPKMGPAGVRFAWGAEFSSTIDMSGHEMSSIDFNVFAGIKYKWLNVAGIGAGANIMVNNSYHTYPVFAIVRTDFSKLVRFLFLDVRGGIALNYLEGNDRQTGGYVSPSLGFNLATGANFRSYITLGYSFYSRKNIIKGEEEVKYPSLSMATVRLGLSF